jgi:hypothetical protein
LFKDLLVAAIRHDKIGTPGSLKKKETHFLPCPVVVRRLPHTRKTLDIFFFFFLNNFNILKYIYIDEEKEASSSKA